MRRATERFDFSHWLRTGRLIWLDPLGAREVKFNPSHDPKDGRFTFGEGGSTSNEAKRSSKTQSAGLNLDKMVDTARSNAEAKSRGQCARYCRMALEAGGADTTGHPIAAKDYGPILERNGFIAVSSDRYIPKSGDVVVSSGNKTHEYGHIAIYNGSAWYSDFKQRSKSPYRGDAPRHIHYRPAQ